MKILKRAPLVLVLLAGLAIAARAGAQASPPDFQVNQVTQGSQLLPDVARDTAGDSVVVWLDRGTVKARLFAASGAPRTGEITVAQVAYTSSPPSVAMTPIGEFDVVWEDSQNIYLRHFDRLGHTPALHLDPLPPGVRHSPDVVLDAAGNAFVVWAETHFDGDSIVLQRFGPNGLAVGPPEQVNQNAPNRRDVPRIALGPNGSLLVSWDDYRTGNLPDVWARRFDGPSAAWAPEARVNPSETGVQQGSAPLLYPEGDGAVVYSDFTAGMLEVRRFDAAGAPNGDPVPVAVLGIVPRLQPDAAAGADGNALAVWEAGDGHIHGGFFDHAWNPIEGDFVVSSQVPSTQDLQPVVAAGGGGFTVAWTNAGVPQVFPAPPLPPGRDGSEAGVFARIFQPPGCAAGSGTLCLDGGRFQATVSWKNPYTGETGTGKTLPLTDDTAAFWFFDAANLELMVKVLDGGAINGHFWVFFGSLSNVEYTLTLTDTVTGTVKTYHNAPLQLGSQADVTAFPSAPATARAAATAAAATAPLAPAAAGTCVADPESLCLNQAGFQVQVSFTDPRTGTAGQGRAVPLTDDTGGFWFFDPTNLELMVKVLDGRAVNGHFWVFYGALSDVDYTITVTDTTTGTRRTYHNAAHHLASGADITAF